MGTAGVQQTLSHTTDSQLNWDLGFEPPCQSQTSGRLKQVSLKIFPVFSAINHSFNSNPNENIPTAWCCQHHASLWGWCSWWWWKGLDIAFSLMAKKLNFSLIWPEYLLPYVWGVSHMPFGENRTCLLTFFFKQWLFFWPHFRKAQLCGVYRLKWSYGQILQSQHWRFAAHSGLSLVSLLLLWLMPSLPGPWVLVGYPLMEGLLWCHILKKYI